MGFPRPIPGFRRAIPRFGRPIPGFGRPLLVADRGRPCGGPGWRGWEPPPQSLRDSSPSGGAIGSGCSWGNSRPPHFGSWIGALRSAVAASSGSLPQAEGEGRAAAQVGAVGSLPLSRCATAPPRGERLDRVVRGATPGWQALARGSARCVRRWLPRVGAAEGGGGGRAVAQVGAVGSLPHSRCATAPPRGERLDRVVRGATPGWQALAPRSEQCVRR